MDWIMNIMFGLNTYYDVKLFPDHYRRDLVIVSYFHSIMCRVEARIFFIEGAKFYLYSFLSFLGAKF